MALQFSDIVRVQQAEKTCLTPTQLPIYFFADLNDLIECTRIGFEKLASEDASAMKTVQMLGVLQKLRTFQNDIVNIRARKVLLMAHQQISGGVPDKKVLTSEEREMLDAVVDALAGTQKKIRAAKHEPKVG